CSGSRIACSEALLRLRTSSRMPGCVGRAPIAAWYKIHRHSSQLRRHDWQSPSHSPHDRDAKRISAPGSPSQSILPEIRASAPKGPKLWSLLSYCYWRNSLPQNARPTFCEKRLTIPTIRLPIPFDRLKRMLDNLSRARADILVTVVASL